MHQGRLLPLHITRLEPSPGNTADCRHIGVGDDGLAWAIKRVVDGQHIPLSEYICSMLAAAVGIAVPPCEVAELPNGELAFASRWEGGTLADGDTRRLFGQPGEVPVGPLWRIHAFDLFVANHDRHAGNYLIREDRAFPDRRQCLAFDFSRALCAAACPVPSFPLPQHCNTMLLWQVIEQIHGRATHEALATVEKIRELPGDSISKLCHALPDTWIASDVLDNLDTWWNHQRPSRLDRIADHFRRRG